MTLASTVGFKEYRNLMLKIIAQHNTYEPRSTALDCPARVWESELEPFDKDILKLMHSYADGLMKNIQDAFYLLKMPETIPPLSK